VDAVIGEKLAQMTTEQADTLCASADIPGGPVQTIAEALEHPAVTMTTVDHPVLGQVKVPGPFFETNQTRNSHTAPPMFNQHRDEILCDLGFDSSAIRAFELTGAFGFDPVSSP